MKYDWDAWGLLALFLLMTVACAPRAQAQLGRNVTCAPQFVNAQGQLDSYQVGCGYHEWGATPWAGQEVKRIDLGQEQGTGKVEVQIGNQPSTFTPSGWSSPTSPPGTAAASGATINGTNYSSETVGCDALKGDRSTCIYDEGGQRWCEAGYPQFGWTCNTGTESQKWNITATCPSGYTNTSGVCTLSNASSVEKPLDGHCNIVRSGNSFSGDPNDPDCFATSENAASHKQGVTVTSATNVTSEGNGATHNITINTTNGTTTVTSTRPNSTGSDSTTNSVTLGPVNANGYAPVIGRSEATTPGQGVSNQAGTEKPRDPCGLPGTPACKIDETGTPTDGTLTPAKEALDTAADARKSTVESVSSSRKVTDLGLSLSISWPSSACSDITFAVPGHGSGTIPLCSRHSDVQAIMSWLVGILTAFTLFYIGVGAVKGA